MKIETEIIPQWETFVEALRKELEEYGALFNLVNEQQHVIATRATESLTALSGKIQSQTRLCNQLRLQREQLIVDLLNDWGINRELSSMAELIPLFPENNQPLIAALVEQINHMIARVRQKVRQNQLLLSRANDIIEQIIFSLQPQTLKTYNSRGGISLRVDKAQGNCIQTSV